LYLLDKTKSFIFVKYFRRPPSENEDFRLDKLLKRKAEEGVMIYIIVYKEVKYSLALDSYHTKKSLQDLHKNIRGIFFWKLIKWINKFCNIN
jgi:hypothetical protein